MIPVFRCILFLLPFSAVFFVIDTPSIHALVKLFIICAIFFVLENPASRSRFDIDLKSSHSSESGITKKEMHHKILTIFHSSMNVTPDSYLFQL